jgi:transcriptional regulator with XRE-family HTH domain
MGSESAIGQRLRFARTAAGLSTRELAKLSGLTTGHPSLIEAGKRPAVSAKALADMARVLGISLDWLVNGSSPEPAEASIKAAVAVAKAAYEGKAA